MNLYAALALLTVTIHASVTYPTMKDPLAYDLNTCTGVFISPDEVLTAGHCVKHSRGRQWIRTAENKSYAVTIEMLDADRDLALLKTVSPMKHQYAFISKAVADRGDRIYTVNSGCDMVNTYNEGMVVNVIKSDGVLTLMHNAVILPGASGSGLFNSKKEIVGINVATFKGLSEAVDLAEIKAFLDKRQ